jgi:hypothetical protein
MDHNPSGAVTTQGCNRERTATTSRHDGFASRTDQPNRAAYIEFGVALEHMVYRPMTTSAPPASVSSWLINITSIGTMRPLRIDQNSVAPVWTERNQVTDLIADFKNNSID